MNERLIDLNPHEITDSPMFLVVLSDEFNTKKDKIIGWFNVVEGTSDRNKQQDEKATIKFSKGFLSKNTFSRKELQCCFVEVCLCDNTGRSMTCISGTTKRIEILYADNKAEVILSVTSLPFLKKSTLFLWCRRRYGLPKIKGEWLKLSEPMRESWLEVAALSSPRYFEERGAVRIALDGRFIEDLLSFFCALGEAVHGPGGYFGRGFGALDDCLSGGFGIKGPLYINWTNSTISREKFDVNGQLSIYFEILEVLDNRQVEVNLL